MEIKFNSTAVPYLRSLTQQVQTREETQELRLTEGMPDIGRILGCWGQPVIRSKEWRSGGMGVSGGVMVWVLYAPEDGSEPQKVETWVPFQQKWDFDDRGRDGFIWVQPMLKSLDARSVSPRKMMVRANISTNGMAMQNAQEETYQAEGLPEDVQLLRQTYPMELPVESGEKILTIDEELGMEPMDQLIRYSMVPTITEWKILGSRLVFKGYGKIHGLYRSGGKLQRFEMEVPFSQFADLDQEHSSAANAVMAPIVTDLELSMEEGRAQLKASVAAQFVIYDRVNVDVVEDTYSPRRDVMPQYGQLKLPARLDQWDADVEQNVPMGGEMGTLVDAYPLMDVPQCRGKDVYLSGGCQVLYYDPSGMLQSSNGRFEQTIPLGQDMEADVACDAWDIGDAYIGSNGDGFAVTLPLHLDLSANCGQGMSVVTGLEMGDMTEAENGRPSLILCRCNSGNLWELAKAHGSTVEAIRDANGLDGEPEAARMLLIPIA